MIKSYFRQRIQYFSQCRGEFQVISDLHPKHAANAAEKLLREADVWAKESAVDTEHPILWMSAQPLYRALVLRAGVDAR